MSEGKHTPEEWHIEETTTDGDIRIVDVQGVTIATVWCQPLDPEEWSQANARLIAAAPEMLDALKAQEMADADPEASRRKGYFDRALDMRRAALANAEGK